MFNSTKLNWYYILNEPAQGIQGGAPDNEFPYAYSVWSPYFQTVLKRDGSAFPPIDMPSMLIPWTAPAQNQARTSLGGWLSYWNRPTSTATKNFVLASQVSAPIQASLGKTLSIGGFPTSTLSITTDGAIYLGSYSGLLTASAPGKNGGLPVLLPFGNQLVQTSAAKIRYGWVEVQGRDLQVRNNEPNWNVFAVEWNGYTVKGHPELPISIQMVLWNDGLVKFYYRLGTSSPTSYLIPGLSIGFFAGASSITIDPTSVLASDASVTLWDNGQLRPGWAFFNSSDVASANPATAVAGLRKNQTTMDLMMFGQQSFFLLAWDYSRDLLDVHSVPQFTIEYNRPTDATPTVWAFDEWRWNVKWDAGTDFAHTTTYATDLKATTAANGLSPNCPALGTGSDICSINFDSHTSYPGATSGIVSRDLLDSSTVGAVKFSAAYYDNFKKAISYTLATPSKPATLQIRSIKFHPDPTVARSVEFQGNLNPLGLQPVSKSTNEGVLPTATALTAFFNTAPASLSAYTATLGSLTDANGTAVPFVATLDPKTNNIVLSNTTAPSGVLPSSYWTGTITVPVTITGPKTTVAGDNSVATQSTVLSITVNPVNKAPTLQDPFPSYIVNYGMAAWPQIDLMNANGIIDESPLSALTW